MKGPGSKWYVADWKRLLLGVQFSVELNGDPQNGVRHINSMLSEGILEMEGGKLDHGPRKRFYNPPKR